MDSPTEAVDKGLVYGAMQDKRGLSGSAETANSWQHGTVSLTGIEGEVTGVEIDPGVAQLSFPAIMSQTVEAQSFLMGEMGTLTG